MNNIKKLPESLINKIAAGEVVERPASVLKELLENSLDAGAKRITVEFGVNEATDYLQVTDDGVGMDRADARAMFDRHATSKIGSEEDLDKIATFGFRGEAVASIAAVSKVAVQTRIKDDPTGIRIACEGGKIVEELPAGCSVGTKILVRDLFYNTPARKKFMKKKATEERYMLEAINQIALMHPDTAIRVVRDKKMVLDLLPTVNLSSRIQAVLGRDSAEKLLPVFYGGKPISISGYMGNFELQRSDRTKQYIFVNGRYVVNKTVSSALRSAYGSLMPKGKYPVAVINIEMPLSEVDVNVHPRKLEVRFPDQQMIFRAVRDATAKALEKGVTVPSMTLEGGLKKEAKDEKLQEKLCQAAMELHEKPFVSHLSDEEQKARYTKREQVPVTEERPMQRSQDDDMPAITPLLQVAESYIIGMNQEGLIIIDQHAAHERILYSKLREVLDAKREDGAIKQRLLLPQTFELSHAEISVLEEHKELLERIGFEIDMMSGNSFALQAIPVCLVEEDILNVIMGVLDDLKGLSGVQEVREREDKALHYIACRSAVKFGRKLECSEQVKLLKDLERAELKYTCPHGRPTMINLTFNELAKKFKRL